MKVNNKQALPVAKESVEQIHLFKWAALSSGRYPELDLMYHIPNGGKRNITTAKKLKAEGTKAGVPDIHLPVARCGYHGLFIELKRREGGTTSKSQEDWLQALKEQGHYTAVCKGCDEATEMIINYLEGNLCE